MRPYLPLIMELTAYWYKFVLRESCLVQCWKSSGIRKDHKRCIASGFDRIFISWCSTDVPKIRRAALASAFQTIWDITTCHWKYFAKEPILIGRWIPFSCSPPLYFFYTFLHAIKLKTPYSSFIFFRKLNAPSFRYNIRRLASSIM